MNDWEFELFVVTSLSVAIFMFDGDRKWRHLKSKMATGSDVTTIQDSDRKWRHHKSKMATGSDVTTIQDSDRKWRHHKSKMATGSDVITNPRWRPEVTSQTQDGDQPQPHHSTKSSPYTTPIARDSWPREILWHDYVVFIYRGPNQVDGSMFQKKNEWDGVGVIISMAHPNTAVTPVR